ncbi:DUF4259 domain-containing protein [Pseudoxanthomonas indica]|uniref:DUF4259 domain-containing protein n=1 Tax=Pseudoxanthomonas indica TaxID=428993 RepID=A0A1T5K8D6_9GAMM|nr:DUF4259 domain-containing protein [Pseudoxanthomonas indica]GGD47396.1 hypothetical protein GCM10007235_19140 [Pseudoxanthomonas indica]SKC59765.1 protein of unknown function [Pseudoxanthomonas indica]
MGAWGPGSFENDDAADFLADVTDSGDLALLREVIDNVLTSTEFVEAPDACQAIVAAEVIAAALGRPTAAALRQDHLTKWVARIRPGIEPALAQRAHNALARILAPNSELLELWEETDELAEWQASVKELMQQLQA